MSEKISDYLKSSNLPNADLWLAEARFGFSHLNAKIQCLGNSSSILEVGCGSGILLCMLSDAFPQHEFEGIEPFGHGFSNLEKLNSLTRENGANITICGYEEYKSTKNFDFIYCVNVFEHVSDWRHFLNWASDMMHDDGIIVVLCPNYGFPYESHFRIPVLFNKNFTHLFFKNYIRKFENRNENFGLWQSLNFVKKKEIVKYLIENKLPLIFNDEIDIIDDMVDRISNDMEFRKRQKTIGSIAHGLRKIGAFRFIKLFPNFLPYMKLTFRRARRDV